MSAVEPDLQPAAGGANRTTAVIAVDAAEPVVVRQRNIGMWLAIGWLVVLGFLVLLTPWLPFIDDPDVASRPIAIEEGPSADHWFGTDQNGRDVFSRVIWGGRVSLTIGFLALIFGFVGGGLLGITSGYFRGRYERLVMSAVDIMLSIPSLVLALALLRALSPPQETAGSLGKVTFVLVILAIPALARITRANTLAYSEREFVTASKALGAKPKRILWKEILPNVIPAMISFSFVALAILIVAEGAFAFLGLSVEAPAATWGKLIQAGSEKMDDAPHLALFPCGVMFFTLFALNYIGDRLQRRFSAREANI